LTEEKGERKKKEKKRRRTGLELAKLSRIPCSFSVVGPRRDRLITKGKGGRKEERKGKEGEGERGGEVRRLTHCQHRFADKACSFLAPHVAIDHTAIGTRKKKKNGKKRRRRPIRLCSETGSLSTVYSILIVSVQERGKGKKERGKRKKPKVKKERGKKKKKKEGREREGGGGDAASDTKRFQIRLQTCRLDGFRSRRAVNKKERRGKIRKRGGGGEKMTNREGKGKEKRGQDPGTPSLIRPSNFRTTSDPLLTIRATNNLLAAGGRKKIERREEKKKRNF